VRVRRALNHAVDRQALVDVIMGGHAVVNSSVCTQTLFGWHRVPGYEYDVAKARRLLAEAGFPNGFETTMLGPVGRYTKDKEIQEAIAGMLAEVGVRIRHVQPEWAQFLQQWTGEAHPMHYIGTGNQVLDCDQHLGYRIDGKRWGRYFQSDAIDALIAEQVVSHDPETRRRILAEIQTKLTEEAVWIFLFDLVDLYGMTRRVEWTPRPDEMIWAYDIKLAG
jgi:peptide/nickel transport system substrate-binding protein